MKIVKEVLEFNRIVRNASIEELKNKVKTLEYLQEKNKIEMMVLIASTPSDDYDEQGMFIHRTEFVKERGEELWKSINSIAMSIALLQYAINEK